MSAFDPLLDDVVQAAMNDWSRPVTLIVVDRSFDATTGQTQTIEVRLTVAAIYSETSVQPRTGTARLAAVVAPTLLIRTGDLPAGRLRAEVGDRLYDVAAHHVRPGGVTALMLTACGAIAASGG